MGAKSKIEWTDSTFNPWVGCTKVARARGAPSACDFCYAEKWAKRSGQVEWGNHPRRRTTEAYWRNPLAWNNRGRFFQTEHGRRQRVFCASLADVFDNQVDPLGARICSTSFVHAMNWMAALDQATAKYSQDAAGRLGRRISERLARHDNGRRARLQAASVAPSQSARSNSLRELRTSYGPSGS